MAAKAHLSRTYRKLWITRRDQWAEALAVQLDALGERAGEHLTVIS
jgi:hypothetical protein